MSLKKYRAKRDLKKTPEPKGKLFKRKKGAPEFVIQKHAASRLHYDFRLEVDGVLKSWAIPKGASTDPQVKHLAIMVEDHPYDYRNFEGIIPSGYGAGTVMIWDHGTYDVDGKAGEESQESIRKGIANGAIHFTLHGDKLHGKYSLIKLKKETDEWLWIKSKDAYANKQDITKHDRSVVSEKSLDEIGGAKGKKNKKPHHLKPMLCTLIDEAFDNNEWIFEIKLDGFRALAELDKNRISLYSRNLKSFNEQFSIIVEGLKDLQLDAILDGEIVALDKEGIPRFQMLQNYTSEKNLYYYVFDILYLNGKDLLGLPLLERKKILKGILKKRSRIRYVDHVLGKGKEFFKVGQQHGLEGIIGKKKDSLYKTGERTKEWVKIKSDHRQEVVICGFTEPRKSRKNFGALIVGVYKNRKLMFAGHVGGGFTEKKLEEVKSLLSPLITKKCPFAELPKTNMAVTWIKPKLMCEVKFKEWTDAGTMRMPIFLGMRSDKSVKTIKKEVPEPLGHDFISNPDKLYWDREKITKKDLLNYYESIGPYILPYLIDRPQSLKRYPDGVSKPSFFQKNLEKHPDWIETIAIEHTDKVVNYMLIKDVKSLLYAVNLGCIEIHPWFSRIQKLDYPDYLVFDLDPEAISFDRVVETALLLRDVLDSLGVSCVCKTSGGRGIHIAVPLGAKYSYEQAKMFAELIALIVHKELPKITSLERSPKNRQKKVYIDCYQNNYAQTLAAPYSVRAKPGAPVSTPLSWDEVKIGLDPADFNLFNTLERVKSQKDPFKMVLGKGVDFKKVLKKLQK